MTDATTVTWIDTCWCCGSSYEVAPDASCGEVWGWCEPCGGTLVVADHVRFMPDGGIEATDRSVFDPTTSYRACVLHGNTEGENRR